MYVKEAIVKNTIKILSILLLTFKWQVNNFWIQFSYVLRSHSLFIIGRLIRNVSISYKLITVICYLTILLLYLIPNNK